MSERIGEVHDIWTFLLDKRDALKQFNNSERGGHILVIDYQGDCDIVRYTHNKLKKQNLIFEI